MTPPVEIFLADEAATARLGAALGKALRAGEAICLTGPLGAGKSALSRALIRSLTSPEEEVPSPTFTLVQTYVTAGFPLSHFDLYRLAGPDEAYEAGLDEALDEGAVLIEWPERLEGQLPRDRLDIDIAFEAASPGGQEEGRRARLTPHGAWEGRRLEF